MAAANGSMSMHQKGPQKEVAIQMSPGCRPSCLPFSEAYRKRFNYNSRLTKQYLHVLSIFIGTLPTAKCHFRPNRNRGPHPALICSHLADVPSRRWHSGCEAKRLSSKNSWTLHKLPRNCMPSRKSLIRPGVPRESRL